MGFTMVPASEHCPKGYYEDIEFNSLHWAFIKSRCFKGAWEKELDALVKRRRTLRRVWGFKCPQAVLFLPLYRRLCPHARWVVCDRNAEAMLDSARRAGWPTPEALLERKKLCEDNLKGATWYAFEDMLEHPWELVEHINKRFQLGASDLQKENAFRFVEYKPMPGKSGANSIKGNKEAGITKANVHKTRNPKEPAPVKKKIHVTVQN